MRLRLRYLLCSTLLALTCWMPGCLTSTECISAYEYDDDGSCIPKSRIDAGHDADVDASTDGGMDSGTGGTGGTGGTPLCAPRSDPGPGSPNCSLLQNAPSACADCLLDFASGTSSFTRASPATLYYNQCFKRYNNGELRLLGDGSVYVEGKRTNWLKHSSNLAQWSPDGPAPLVGAGAVAYSPGAPFADGVPSRTYFGTGEFSRLTTTTDALDDPTVISLFYRHPADVDFVFRTDILKNDAEIDHDSTELTATDQWSRAVLFMDDFASERRVRVQRPADAPSVCDEGGEIRIPGPIVFGAQVETVGRSYDGSAPESQPALHTFPSQPIETANSAATRQADSLEFDNLSPAQSAAFDSAWEIDIWPAFATDELLADVQSVQTILSFENTNASITHTIILYRNSADGNARFVFQHGDRPVYLNISGPELNWERNDKITIKMDQPERRLTVKVHSGGAIATKFDDDAETPFTFSGVDRVRIGSESFSGTPSQSKYHFFGRISAPRPSNP